MAKLRKPTLKQRRALDKLVENGGNVSKSMREAGYSPQTAKSPHKLTSSPTFIALCEERGLTDNLLVDALVEDIQKKPGNRKGELELGFKVRRHLSENKTDFNVFANGPVTFSWEK